ncbi:metal ABC transporter substrate-binding protein [Thermosediminibacter litoriperuensis]|uniref:Zinc transport system substrate-binding protein n=1 Tax=Thermosediminibacter litoriperuensis TaxID=291989 RepID=A0A5S5ALF3_9FIRM|nr:metal ABC transporter substrate-binding protein [Thermosediminibacter litoriperuensis]TYP51674.1 zinc transport system substrate-binding protein [Thermosediminibacter litoriperuensis]
MKSKRVTAAFLLVMVTVFVLSACSSRTYTPAAPQVRGKIRVYTTVYPLYDFASKIAGDRAEVVNVTPAGVEAHDFEPSPRTVADIYEADVFVYLGGPMDPWAEKLAKQLAGKGVAVAAAEGVLGDEGREKAENHENDEARDQDHDHSLDPHVWLDPIVSKILAERIAEALIAADGKNVAYYRQNLEVLKNRLDDLDKKYREALSGVKRRDFVVNHDAFGYLARRYELNQIAISGLSPQQEPSFKKLAELARICREKDIKYIFLETAAGSKLAETLAREVGAGILVLNPIESLTEDEMKAGEDYFSVMEKNLENLKKALAE